MASARNTRERTIDQFDRKILAVLSTDGRATLAELAERVGLSQSPCWTRLRRLEERGVLKGYAALIGAALVKLPEVLEAHLVTGDYDYLVKIAVSGTDHYEAFLRDKLYKIKGIRNSRSMFGLRALKHVASVDPMLVVD
jgi:Lrp/AsnC family leucine-responsive transcriptional regulator